ncbi:hypothetical protein BP5796_03490 [Coleophoma crateriformis]|uniref:DUF7624 domain-containing protein n=1 Tax=Coleophoma crateriformis TaxID=565419 RepID=A0A3D8SND5_9HELO|nr:hypothetical protein BP5796_03490 [Coleophoma crateriformis]
MALESPLVSAGNHMSAFSPHPDFSMSPHSPAMPNPPRYHPLSPLHSTESSLLNPSSIDGGLSPGGQLTSPSDMVGPSPVTSNGTETTDFDDETMEENHEHTPPHSMAPDGSVQASRLSAIRTSLPEEFRASVDDESVSVIHAPQGYGSFERNNSTITVTAPQSPDRATPIPYKLIDDSLSSDKPAHIKVDRAVPSDKTAQPSPKSPPPISTDVQPVKYGPEHATPRAQTRKEIEALSDNATPYARNSTAVNLQGIPEDQGETEEDDFDVRTVQNSQEEIAALDTALHECWTLCNTLASLSSIHRERIFSYSGTGDAHEIAWKCCWKLCQKLYDSRDDEIDFQVQPTLDLCRDFCQALFDVRQRKNEIDDSVLRVSFELNNHLFNTHDRTLPEAFRERTLDFYITLCHRLMKQRGELAEETDSLLRACWGLAEMLFSLRQNKREGKAADEELLGSAVQACWELCDLFREGWTQVRPDRGTPRPSQTTFGQSSDLLNRSSHTLSNSLDSLPEQQEDLPIKPPQFPETPTTEFEDTPISPEANSPNIPNILVLGTDNSRTGSTRWSSTASNLSGYSQGSNRSTNTVTSTGNTEDINLTRLKTLILKAAMNVGFDRNSSSTATGTGSPPPALQTFVKSLPTGSFGSLPSHANLLRDYRNLVLSDPTFRSKNSLPAPGKKVSAVDVAKSVTWMMRSGQYTFLKDLFRLVFGFKVDEAEKRQSISITV